MYKPIRFFLLISMLFCFQSCITTHNMEDTMGHYYAWKFSIRNGQNLAKNCHFENDSVDINFDPTPTQINFSVRNKLSKRISLIWDSSFFYQNQLVSPLALSLFDAPKYSKYTKVSIEAGSKITGHLFPLYVMNPKNDSLRGVFSWVHRKLYPDYDERQKHHSAVIMGALGLDIFALNFHFTYQGISNDYVFTFYPIEIERKQQQP